MRLPLQKQFLLYLFTAIYCVALVMLSGVWYNSYTSFHFFDDLFEWEFLDKIGHGFSSFYLGVLFYKTFGNEENLSFGKKKWLCFAGFVLLLPIEILDGFSLNYGCSPADLLTNGIGSIFCYVYFSYRIVSSLTPKFSFHKTAFSLMRPEMLGSTFLQQTLKDYNGQTYWLSVNVNSVLNKNILPSWLLITIGYGAEGLLGGHDNVWQNAEGKTIDYSHVARTKRFFISVDLNVHPLRERNKIFHYILSPFLLLKFPAPAIEFNAERGIIFHPIYF